MTVYNADDVKIPTLPRRQISRWIRQVAALHGKTAGEIAYIFCSDAKILEINRQYLDHDYFTDIITFDYTEDNTVSGDLFISVDTVRSNAAQFGTSFDDELHRVMIHGILHLCGINDKSPDERAVMEQCENEALRLLQAATDSYYAATKPAFEADRKK